MDKRVIGVTLLALSVILFTSPWYLHPGAATFSRLMGWIHAIAVFLTGMWPLLGAYGYVRVPQSPTPAYILLGGGLLALLSRGLTGELGIVVAGGAFGIALVGATRVTYD